MPTGKPVPIPFPVSSFPGANPQESAGRLINCYAEPLGEQGRGGISPQVHRRAPGLSVFARTANTGYRGGLIVNNLAYECWSGVATTVDASGNVTTLGSFPGTKNVSIARDQVQINTDVVAVDIDNGAYILNTSALANATVTATIAGSVFTSGDSIALQFLNTAVTGFPVTVTYTLGGGESATTIATGLKNLINGNATLAAGNVAATSVLGVLTITQQGAIGNSTLVNPVIIATGNETVTMNPASGQMAGGTGTPGITFTGVPLAFNGGGNLPQPNSVSFQDGYFFFTIGDGRVFATALNTLTVNALTFVTIQSHPDVNLLRAIAYNGVMFFFTTGSLEVWQDVANPAPNFPYARINVLEYGLLQPNAIAGFETGFSLLLWVDQDYSVRFLPTASITPEKVSSPDLERLIEASFKAGDTLVAGISYFAGKKFWHLSSSTWTWQINLETMRWNERWSLQPTGIQGRWRAVAGHPAFGKILIGDMFSGNLLFLDDQNYTEVGMPQLFRLESGPVAAFPASQRIARADFLFDMGVGQAVGNFKMTVTGTQAGADGAVQLLVNDTSQAQNKDTVMVTNVGGTTEANGVWPITVINATTIELVGSVFVNAWTSGGVAVDLTSPPQAINPVCAVSTSLDGGLTWGNPLIRALGQQGRAKRSRASVKNMGLSSPMGNRWRLDVTDPVYTGFLMGTQSNDPREVGA